MEDFLLLLFKENKKKCHVFGLQYRIICIPEEIFKFVCGLPEKTYYFLNCIAVLLTAELWPRDVITLHKIEMWKQKSTATSPTAFYRYTEKSKHVGDGKNWSICYMGDSRLTTHPCCTSLQNDSEHLACLAPPQQLEWGSEPGSSVFSMGLAQRLCIMLLPATWMAVGSSSVVQVGNAINLQSAGNKWPLI